MGGINRCVRIMRGGGLVKKNSDRCLMVSFFNFM
jgi:hypothetical protein